MTDQLPLLIQLQDIDRQRTQQKEREQELVEKLKTAERTFEMAKGESEQFRAKKTQLEKKKHAKELELKIHDDDTVKLKEKVTKLKTNEEYKAHIKEVERAGAKKGEMEEALLLLMEEEDLLKKEGSLKEKQISDAKRQFDTYQKEVASEREALLASAASTDERWGALSEKVDPLSLNQYKHLLVVGKGLAVVPLSGSTCTGCHFSLPPQLIAEVKIGDKLHTCTYCHRILYIVPAPSVSSLASNARPA